MKIDSGAIQLTAAERASDGTFFLLSAPGGAVFLLDSLGRTKAGLGVFSTGSYRVGTPTALGLIGDTLWLGDSFRRRITLFSTKGKTIREYEFSGNGEPWLSVGPTILLVPFVQPNRFTSQSHRLEVFRQSGPASKPTRVFEAPGGYHVLQVSVGLQQAITRQPFEDGPLWTYLRDGTGFLYVTRETLLSPSPSVVVRRVASNGRTVFEARIRYLPVPLDSSTIAWEVDRLVQRFARSKENVDSPPELLRRRVYEVLYIPNHAPSVTRVFGSQDGTVWLRREATARSNVRWTVLAPSGSPVFDILLPLSFEPLWANQTALLGSVRDSVQQLSLVKWTIR